VKVARPALIAYTFAQLPSEDGERPNSARNYLEGLWRGWHQLGHQLASTTPVGDLTETPTDFRWPRKQWNRRLEIVSAAARRRSPAEDSPETYETFLYATHDTAIFIGSLAPNREEDTLDTWEQLYDDWQRLSGDPPDGLLGQSCLCLAALTEPGISIEQLDQLDGPVHDALPGNHRGRQRWRFTATHRVAFWGGEGRAGEPRMIAALSPEGGDETTLAELVWWNERQPHELVPFARYLLNAAKLRFSARVYDRDAEEKIIKPRDQVDASVARVMHLHEQLAGQHQGSIEEVVKAQDELSRHQAASAGLFEAMTKLRELKHGIEIAARNIELSMPELGQGRTAADTDASPFAADLQRAERLAEQFEYDLSFCDAVRDRAEEAQKLTRLRVEEAVERGSRVQNRLTVIQSAFIGALLAGLGAIQALNPNIGIANYLRLPVVALVAGFVLAAPLLILHAYEPYRRVDYGAACVLGATAGWFIVALLWGNAPLVWAALGGAAFGAALLWFLAGRLDRLLTREGGSRQRAEPG
jgi:hypothetical protein